MRTLVKALTMVDLTLEVEQAVLEVAAARMAVAATEEARAVEVVAKPVVAKPPPRARLKDRDRLGRPAFLGRRGRPLRSPQTPSQQRSTFWNFISSWPKRAVSCYPFR